jgi:hypothetical protein
VMFQKKPLVVHAIAVAVALRQKDLPEWVTAANKAGKLQFGGDFVAVGERKALAGDWLVLYPDGTVGVYSGDAFALAFEPMVGQPAPARKTSAKPKAAAATAKKTSAKKPVAKKGPAKKVAAKAACRR